MSKSQILVFPQNSSGGGIQSIVAGAGIMVDNTDPDNPIVSSSGANIAVVANYSALPPVATVSGQFFWCSASQGVPYTPSWFFGTYYPDGLYYSNGTTWEYLDVPYQATQGTVDSGVNNDQFITPLTLTNSSQLLSKQDKSIVISANETAVNDGSYTLVASATFTDPSPVEGKGFIVFVRNGTATVGGTAYATAGTVIKRSFHSGAWVNYPIDITSKQDTLVSGTNIKTINGNSLLGSGNVTVGDALTTGNLSQFASTTSAQFASIISDETGTGSVVFANTPTLVTPILGVASATSVTITGTGGAGYVQLPLQSSAPAAVNNAMILYPNASNRFSIVRRNNANSADITHTHIYPDASYDWSFPTPASGSSSTLAGLETAQTFTQVNRFSNTSGTELYSLKIFDVAAGTYDNAIDAPSGNQLRINGLGASMGINLNASTICNGIFFCNSINPTTGGGGITIGNTGTAVLLTTNSRTIASALKNGLAIVSGNHTGAVSGANTQDIAYITGSSTSASGTSSTTGSHLFEIGTIAGTGTRGGISFFNGTTTAVNATEPNWQGMQRGIFIGNATALPTGNPTGGGYLFVDAGALKWRGSSGTVTTIANA